MGSLEINFFFFSSRRRHTRCGRDWNSDVCSSDLLFPEARQRALGDGGAGDQGSEGNIRTMSDILERLADVVESRKAGDPEKSDRKSTRLNSSHVRISYAVFCLKKKKKKTKSEPIQ